MSANRGATALGAAATLSAATWLLAIAVPSTAVYRVLFAVADAAALSALLLARSRRPAARWGLAPLASAALLGGAALCALDPVAGALVLAGAATLAWLATRAPWGTRALAAATVAGTFAAKVLVLGASALTEWGGRGAALGEAPRAGPERAIDSPARRYHFAWSRDGSRIASFVPQDGVTLVYAAEGEPSRPPLRTLDLGVNRACPGPDGHVLAVDFRRGLAVLDGRDFGVRVAPVEPPGEHRWMGVGWLAGRGEILVLRGDGELSTRRADAPGVELARTNVLEGSWPRVGEEQAHGLYVDPRAPRAVVATSDGTLLVYDADARAVVARRRVLGPTGNVVFPGDGGAYVATMLDGALLALSLPSLDARRVATLGPGFRYLALDPRGPAVLAANYFTGRVDSLDPIAGTRSTVAAVGPRPQWLAFDPAGGALWISHALGLASFPRAALAPRQAPWPALPALHHPLAALRSLARLPRGSPLALAALLALDALLVLAMLRAGRPIPAAPSGRALGRSDAKR